MMLQQRSFVCAICSAIGFSFTICGVGCLIAADGPPPARTTLPRAKADYSRHIEGLKKRLPNDGFSIVIQPPFIVIGDEPAETVKRRSQQTVKWAVDHLKREYFSDDPTEIIDIWTCPRKVGARGDD